SSMDQKVFPLAKAGEYLNAHFINVHVQMDQTPGDGQEIRDWYDDAKELAKKYEIGAYPTYLFFSPDGRLVHKATGSMRNDTELVKLASAAMAGDGRLEQTMRFLY